MKKSVLIIGFLFLLMMFSVLATEEPAIVGKGAKVGAEALDDKITTYNPVGEFYGLQAVCNKRRRET